MATILRKLGGVERTFTIPSVEQLENLTYTIPNPGGEVVDLRGLDRWSKNPVGCEHFISASLNDPTIKREDIRKWGSVIERTNLANELLITSLSTGEDVPSPNG